MARTIESIGDSHHAAEERRAAGKPIWDRTLRIKHLLSKDSDDETARETARQIAAALKGSTWAREDKTRYGDASEVQYLVTRLRRTTTLKRLNALLDELYDLADADRVWIA